MLPALLVGVVLGVTALSRLDRTWMVRALGVTVVAISALNLVAPALRAPAGRAADLVAGLVGGLLGGAFNTGGPPLVAHLYARHEAPEVAKGTIQALFLSISLTRLPVATAQGLMTGPVWRDAALAAPFVVGGLLVGLRLGRRLHAEHFHRVSWIGLGTLGLALLASA
jgi:uncharacterized membrane protein YfcA